MLRMIWALASLLTITGARRTPCGPGFKLCGSTCVDVTADPFNCGECGSVCIDTSFPFPPVTAFGEPGLCSNSACSECRTAIGYLSAKIPGWFRAKDVSCSYIDGEEYVSVQPGIHQPTSTESFETFPNARACIAACSADPKCVAVQGFNSEAYVSCALVRNLKLGITGSEFQAEKSARLASYKISTLVNATDTAYQSSTRGAPV